MGKYLVFINAYIFLISKTDLGLYTTCILAIWFPLIDCIVVEIFYDVMRQAYLIPLPLGEGRPWFLHEYIIVVFYSLMRTWPKREEFRQDYWIHTDSDTGKKIAISLKH